MSLIGSSSAQMLLLMLLPLFVFQQSSAASIMHMASTRHPCDFWNDMFEFNADLKTLQNKVNSCPDGCSSAGMNAECPCLDIKEPLDQHQAFPCNFATWLMPLRNSSSEVYSGSRMMNLINHLNKGCQCESVNTLLQSQNYGPVSPKALLGKLKNCMQEYKTESSTKAC